LKLSLQNAKATASPSFASISNYIEEKKKGGRGNDNRAPWRFSGKDRERYGEIVERGLQKTKTSPASGTSGEPELFLSQIKHSGNKVSAHRERSTERPKLACDRNTPMLECTYALHTHTRANTRRAVTHVPCPRGFLRLLRRKKNSNARFKRHCVRSATDDRRLCESPSRSLVVRSVAIRPEGSKR